MEGYWKNEYTIENAYHPYDILINIIRVTELIY